MINFEKLSWAETDVVSALVELENIVIVVYNDNTRNKKGGLYGDQNYMGNHNSNNCISNAF